MGRSLKLVAPLAVAFALISPAAFATGNAEHGADLFKRCMVCHTSDKGGANRIGPNLFGVIGRKSGTLAGYSFSRAMTGAGIVWSEENLVPYLQAPSKVVAGTKMTFAGFSDATQAQDVAAYLATLK